MRKGIVRYEVGNAQPGKQKETMEILVFIFIAFVVFVVSAIVSGSGKATAAAETEQSVAARYRLDDLYVSAQDQNWIGISFEERKVMFGSSGHPDSACDFSQITAVEVIEDGATVTQTGRGSQLAGALIGGAVFGGVGALVGGLTGKTYANARVRNIYLRVTLEDRIQPVRTICFLKWPSKKGLEPDNFIAKHARTAVEQMHGHLRNAMRQGQADQRYGNDSAELANRSSSHALPGNAPEQILDVETSKIAHDL